MRVQISVAYDRFSRTRDHPKRVLNEAQHPKKAAECVNLLGRWEVI